VTDTEVYIEKVNRANSLEALSDIARDVEAMMAAEHAPDTERRILLDHVERRTVELARRLMA